MAADAATVAHSAAASEHGHATNTGASNEKLAMWTFLGSECLLFGALISVFMLYRSRVASGPLPHEVFDIPFTSVSSFVLLMSSLTMVLALSALQRDQERTARVWLTATALLGMTFIGGQVYEFTTFVHEGVTLTSNPASSAFFVLTGFHGTHVTLGIIMLLSLVGFSLAGKLGPRNALQVELVGLYWHFVDIVWVVIFTVVYLMPAPK